MDSSGHHRVIGDSGSRPNSPISVDGWQDSRAPLIHEQVQVAEGTIDILQQIAQALQKVAPPAVIVPQRSTIERMAKY